MAYRDETEALRAQLVALEARVAELEQENATLLASDGKPSETLFGKSLNVTATAKVEGWLPKKEARRVLDRAESFVGERGSTVGGDELAIFRATSQDLELSIRRDGENTVVRVAERISLVTGAMIGGVFGGAGGVVALALLLAGFEPNARLLVLFGTPVWALVMYGLARFLLSRNVKRAQRKVDGLVASLLVHLPKTLPPASGLPSSKVLPDQ